MRTELNRREWLTTAGKSLAGIYLGRTLMSYASTAPTAPVSVAKCPNYGDILGSHSGKDVRSIRWTR